MAFRPDHLVIADANGSELADVLLGAARGQLGIVASLAARSADEALLRLRAFVGPMVGAGALAPLAASAIDLIVVGATNAEGGVRVAEMAELRADGDALSLSFVARRPERSRGSSPPMVVGVSSQLADSIASAGQALPSHLVRP